MPIWSPVSKKIRTATATAGIVLVAVFFLFVDLGGSVRGYAFHGGPGQIVPGLIAIAIWSGPYLVFRRSVRTLPISVVGGALLFAASAAGLIVLFLSEGSTAAIGIITLASLVYAVIVPLVMLDRSAERQWVRAEGRRPPEADPEGLSG